MTENLPPQDEPQPPQSQPGQAQPEQAHQPQAQPPVEPQQPQPQPSPTQTWWHQQGAATPPYGAPEQQPYGAAGPVATRARPKRKVSTPIVVTAIIAGLIGGGVGIGGSALLASGDNPPVLSSQPPSASQVSSQAGSVAYAAEVATKFTVDIKIPSQQGTVTGTGIILTQDGYVLTNNHVVSGAANGGKIQVTTADGKKLSATVKGTAPSYDLAVIKLDNASGLTPAVLGQSNSLKVGQPVAAVGSPEQLSNTVTAGIISALSRTVKAGGEDGGGTVVYNGLQTDAPINPGNSGGPLVNMDGQVVAVNSAVEPGQSGNGGLQAYGLGFSIPIDKAKQIANELMQNGKAAKPVLGVSGSVQSQPGSANGGTQLAGVQDGGPAAQAGIKQGDTITAIDKTPINSYADLMAEVLKHTPGQQVPVAVQHADGSQQDVTVTLGSATDTEQTTVPQQPQDQQGNPFGGIPGFGGR
ncbi:S1C family serine protease [Amycolatopsis minnesotensis]|uniref:Trypsin-like peptidase domain-containing protein n=1 Tax=Amycolatopsis minnesotensis TaxID=337894 RepID=A0ABN2RMI2_9PSEU